MKMSKAETRILVKHFKKLVEKDVVGITVSDARNTVFDWLNEIGQVQTANDFQGAVHKYETSAKVENQRITYNEQY